jgi:hypothetical protein
MKKSLLFIFVLMYSIVHGQTIPPKASVVYNSETYTSDQPYNLNVVYFLPKDQALDNTYKTRLSGVMLNYQNWVKTQMINSGFGNKTFGLLTKQSDPTSVLINFIQAKEPVTSYPYNGGAGKVFAEIDDFFKANPLLKNSEHTLIIIPTLDITGNLNLPYYGMGKSAFIIDYPQYQPSHFGSGGNGDWSGGNLHEMAHGLNVSHSSETVQEAAVNTQGTSIMRWHGTFGISPTFINRAGCAVLNTSQVCSAVEKTFYNGNLSKVTSLNAVYDNGALVVSGTFQSTQPVTDVNIYQDPNATPSAGYQKVAWSVSPNGNSFTVRMPTNGLYTQTGAYNLQVELVLGNGEIVNYSYPFSYNNGVPTINIDFNDLSFTSATACSGLVVPITGTVIGSTGSWGGGTSTRDKVFDGNINTYFDGSTANGQWAGLDLGSNQNITCIKFTPREGSGDRMVGGKFQISTDAAFTNPTTIYTITTMPTFKDYYITSKLTEGVSARYIRYLSPDGGFGNIAEVTVYGPIPSFINATACSGSTVQATGTVIGTTGSWGGGTSTRDKVFDGNTSTYFDGSTANGQWAGLDMGSNRTITCIKFTPRDGSGDRMVGGKFQISTDATFTNPTTIYTITTIPTFKDYYITSPMTQGVSARYIRYLSPDGGFGNIAEMAVFINGSSARLVANPLNTKSIKEVEISSEVTVFPNPTENVLHVNIVTKTSGDVQIYNMQGQRMFHKSGVENSFDIHVGDWTNGFYVLRFGKQSVKFIKR